MLRAVRAVAGADVAAVDDAVVGRDAVMGLRAETRDEFSALLVDVSRAEAVELSSAEALDALSRALLPPVFLPAAVLTGLADDRVVLGAATFFAVFFSSPPFVAESAVGLSAAAAAVPFVREVGPLGSLSLEIGADLAALVALLAVPLLAASSVVALTAAAGALVGAAVAVPFAVPLAATAAGGLLTGAAAAAVEVAVDVALEGDEDAGVAVDEAEAEVDRRGVLEAAGD